MNDLKLRNSRFLKLINNKNVFCLLHSLTLNKVYGNDVLRAAFYLFSKPNSISVAMDRLSTSYPKEVVSRLLGDLLEKGMIVPNDRRDLEIYANLFKQGMSQRQIHFMYLLPTSECNLGCNYCFVEDPERSYRRSEMSTEIAEKTLNVFAKLTEKTEKATIVFYGGEPLLNKKVVYFAMRHVRFLEKKGVFKCKVGMSLLTNGTLIDDETVKVAKETRTSVSVSIDGPAGLHDCARVDASGAGTFERAVKGYRKLQDGGIWPSVSCTLGTHNVNCIEELVDFIIKDLRPSSLGFNIIIPKVNARTYDSAYYELAAKQLTVAFDRLRKHGIYEDRVMRRATPFAEKGFHLKDCMSVGGQIVVTPEGRIGPCQALLGFDEFFPLVVDDLYAKLPSLTSDYVYEDPLFNEWSHRFPLNMIQCADCFAIAICGGGCPYASYVKERSIWAKDERICFQAKEILQWMIWDTYKRFAASTQNDN